MLFTSLSDTIPVCVIISGIGYSPGTDITTNRVVIWRGGGWSTVPGSPNRLFHPCLVPSYAHTCRWFHIDLMHCKCASHTCSQCGPLQSLTLTSGRESASDVRGECLFSKWIWNCCNRHFSLTPVGHHDYHGINAVIGKMAVFKVKYSQVLHQAMYFWLWLDFYSVAGLFSSLTQYSHISLSLLRVRCSIDRAFNIHHLWVQLH